MLYMLFLFENPEEDINNMHMITTPITKHKTLQTKKHIEVKNTNYLLLIKYNNIYYNPLSSGYFSHVFSHV